MNLVGIALAVHLGYPIGWPEALIFQVSLTSFQIAGALVNEYADAEADRANLNRTMLTGGSGALSPGRLDRSAALAVALPFAALGISAAVALATVYAGIPLVVAGMMSLTLLEETVFLVAFRKGLRRRKGYAWMTMLGAAFFMLLLVTAIVTLWDY